MSLLGLLLTWVAVSVISGLILRRLTRRDPPTPCVTVNVVLDQAGVEALIRAGREADEVARLERMVRR